MQEGRLRILLLFLIFAACLLIAGEAFAGGASEELKLTCAKGIKFTNAEPGKGIVYAVFSTIQSFLTKIGAWIYVNIVNSFSFQAIIGALMGLYIAIYGAMIMLNLAYATVAEVTSRLLRLAVFYCLLIYGVSSWIYFDRWFVTPFLGGMNDLITSFSYAAGGVPVIPPPLTLLPPTTTAINAFLSAVVAPSLDPMAVSSLYVPMNVLFSPFYLIAIMAMIFLKGAGPIFAGIMIWAFFEFTMLVLNALIVYVRSVVGLTFMFGIAPIFIAFLLFKNTRNLFLGWLNLVIGFSLTPVFLFAFLAFFSLILSTVVQTIFLKVDFCWTTMFTSPGSTIAFNWWRPAMMETDGIGNNYWVIQSGDWDFPPPINIVNLLLFLFLSHLGKNFSMYVGKLAERVSDGIGTSVTPGLISGDMMRSAVMSGRGTGSSGLGGLFGPQARQSSQASSRMGAIDAGPKPQVR